MAKWTKSRCRKFFLHLLVVYYIAYLIIEYGRNLYKLQAIVSFLQPLLMSVDVIRLFLAIHWEPNSTTRSGLMVNPWWHFCILTHCSYLQGIFFKQGVLWKSVKVLMLFYHFWCYSCTWNLSSVTDDSFWHSSCKGEKCLANKQNFICKCAVLCCVVRYTQMNGL